jgi:hypothetical protein
VIYAAWFIAVLAIAEALERWYLSRDIDYEEGGFTPDRMVCWGTCRSLSGNHDFRYFKLVVPFARDWRVHWSSNSGSWHELIFMRFAGVWRRYWTPVQ